MRGRYTEVSSLVRRELVLSQGHTLNGGKENKVCVYFGVFLKETLLFPLCTRLIPKPKNAGLGTGLL